MNRNNNSNKTLAAFAAAAKIAPANVAPPNGPTGGVLGKTANGSNTTVSSTGTGVPYAVATTNAAALPASVSQVGGLFSFAMMVMGLML